MWFRLRNNSNIRLSNWMTSCSSVHNWSGKYSAVSNLRRNIKLHFDLFVGSASLLHMTELVVRYVVDSSWLYFHPLGQAGTNIAKNNLNTNIHSKSNHYETTCWRSVYPHVHFQCVASRDVSIKSIELVIFPMSIKVVADLRFISVELFLM